MRMPKHAREMVTKISEMTHAEFVDFVYTLQPLATSCREVYILSDTLVLKIAPFRFTEGEEYGEPDCACDLCADGDACEDPDCDYEHSCGCEEEQSSYFLGQNIAEAAFWRRYENDPKTRKLLARVYGASENGRWLVMERVNPIHSRYVSVDSKSQLLRKLYDIGIYDMSERNMGVRDNGQLVALDYGISEDWEEITGEQYG